MKLCSLETYKERNSLLVTLYEIKAENWFQIIRFAATFCYSFEIYLQEMFCKNFI